MARKLRKDKRVWNGEFSNGDGKKLLFDDFICSESEFQRVGTATELVPAWVLTLETDNKWKTDERSYLGLGAKESMENRYEGSPEERVW